MRCPGSNAAGCAEPECSSDRAKTLRRCRSQRTASAPASRTAVRPFRNCRRPDRSARCRVRSRCDLVYVRVDDRTLVACERVFGQLADGFEQTRSKRVIKIFRRNDTQTARAEPRRVRGVDPPSLRAGQQIRGQFVAEQEPGQEPSFILTTSQECGVGSIRMRGGVEPGTCKTCSTSSM